MAKSFILNDTTVYSDFTAEAHKKGLPAGTYQLHFDAYSKTSELKQFKLQSDGIVDLPDPVFQTVVNDLQTFCSKTSQDQFDKYLYIYKKQILLHGRPGTGKTCIVIRLAEIFRKEF